MPRDSDAILDELLVLRCLRRDATAPGELVARFQRPLLYYLRRLLADETDAWDASQETWLSVFKSLHTLREPRMLAAYIFRVGRNAAYAHLRRRHVAVLPDDFDAGDIRDDEASADDYFFAREDARRLHEALGRLTLSHRDVLTLHFLQDLTIAQIAEVVGVPAGTIKSRIFHAKLALRELLEQGAGHD